MGICRSSLRFCRDCLSSVLDEEDEEQQEERDIHEEQGSVGVGHLQNNYENYVNSSFSRDEQNYAIANSLSDQDDEYVEVHPQNDNIYVALLDYSTGQAGHLSFSKGEKFQIIKEFPNGLCQVRNIGPGPSGRVGLLSKSHLAKDESFNDNPWYHGNISKTDVQRLLLSPNSLNGSFLVRNSETRHDQFVLAVRETSSTPELKYYPIHEVNSEYFLSSSDRRFKTLSTFVQYYQTADQRDLPTRLTSPITKYEQIPAQRPFQIVHRKWEIDRKHLRMGNEIGSGQFGIVYRAKWKGNQDVAVKTLKTDLMDKSSF
ncbi:tyrosine-protein kinase FRK-like [Clavelina lepadiformis]|uniref:tyrosine-protein kinase FRK-like n=1 Tax=Clavelina lepadiformis TaxID=159417 RepID=UPI0040428F02